MKGPIAFMQLVFIQHRLLPQQLYHSLIINNFVVLVTSYFEISNSRQLTIVKVITIHSHVLRGYNEQQGFLNSLPLPVNVLMNS